MNHPLRFFLGIWTFILGGTLAAQSNYLNLTTSINASYSGESKTVAFSVDDGGVVNGSVTYTSNITYPFCRMHADPFAHTYLTFSVLSWASSNYGYVLWTVDDQLQAPAVIGVEFYHDLHLFGAFYEHATRSWTIVELGYYTGVGPSGKTPDYACSITGIGETQTAITWTVSTTTWQNLTRRTGEDQTYLATITNIPYRIAPQIVTQPTSKIVTAGMAVTFAVVANGSPSPHLSMEKGKQ